jgi:hypothetical protein
MKSSKQPGNGPEKTSGQETPAIGEGKPNSAVDHESKQRKTGYPRPGVADKQYDTQPEFIEPDNNLKEEDQ